MLKISKIKCLALIKRKKICVKEQRGLKSVIPNLDEKSFKGKPELGVKNISRYIMK